MLSSLEAIREANSSDDEKTTTNNNNTSDEFTALNRKSAKQADEEAGNAARLLSSRRSADSTDAASPPPPASAKSCCRLCATLKGYIFALIAAVSFSVSNICVKKANLLSGSDHLVVYFVVMLPLMFLFIGCNRANPLGPKGTRVLLSVRGLLGVFSLVFFYCGLLLIPPSDCSAISHSSIIITAIFARLFLKEKLGIVHFVALAFTIAGVLLISKPSILFPRTPLESSSISLAAVRNYSSRTLLSSQLNATQDAERAATLNTTGAAAALNNGDSNTLFLIGIGCVVLAALLFGIIHIVIKKLCNRAVHWAVNTNYSAYFGLPVSVAISLAAYMAGYTHRDWSAERAQLPAHLAYSVASALAGVLGQVAVNISLNHEDATKVAIAKTSDILVSFVLQLIILNIRVDLLSILGSLAIFLGTILVLSFKILESSVLSRRHQRNGNGSGSGDGDAQADRRSQSACVKCILFKL